jgi:hypothetical protein
VDDKTYIIEFDWVTCSEIYALVNVVTVREECRLREYLQVKMLLMRLRCI